MACEKRPRARLAATQRRRPRPRATGLGGGRYFASPTASEAARNNAGETAGLDPRPDFVPTGCPNCPRLTGNAFKTLRFAVVDLGHGGRWEVRIVWTYRTC